MHAQIVNNAYMNNSDTNAQYFSNQCFNLLDKLTIFNTELYCVTKLNKC